LIKIHTELETNIDFSKQNNQLSRGHLTANSDFVFAPLMVATYDYYNAAPQWQGFNGVNWSEVELQVRIYVGTLGHDVRVYTGVYVS
jgi:DNA/RNA endonuclease G (NUC1)